MYNTVASNFQQKGVWYIFMLFALNKEIVVV